MDRRAPPGSGLPERRPALPRLRGGAPAQAAGAAASAVLRDPGQPRLRHLARPLLGADRGARPRARAPALGRGRDDRAARASCLRGRLGPACPLVAQAETSRRPRRRRRGPERASLPLPAGGGRTARGGLRPRARRPHARRPDQRPVSGRQAAPRPSERALHERAVPPAGGNAPRLARPRHHVRALPLLRAARRRPSSILRTIEA